MGQAELSYCIILPPCKIPSVTREIGPLGLKNRPTVSNYLFQRNINSTPTYLNVCECNFISTIILLILFAPSVPPQIVFVLSCFLILWISRFPFHMLQFVVPVLPLWNGLLSHLHNSDSLFFFIIQKSHWITPHIYSSLAGNTSKRSFDLCIFALILILSLLRFKKEA